MQLEYTPLVRIFWVIGGICFWRNAPFPCCLWSGCSATEHLNYPNSFWMLLGCLCAWCAGWYSWFFWRYSCRWWLDLCGCLLVLTVLLRCLLLRLCLILLSSRFLLSDYREPSSISMSAFFGPSQFLISSFGPASLPKNSLSCSLPCLALSAQSPALGGWTRCECWLARGVWPCSTLFWSKWK